MDSLLLNLPSHPLERTDEMKVAPQDTAAILGSGELPVLATPRLVAWLEQTAWRAIAPHLPQGHTSVGTMIQLEHMAPSAVGGKVVLRAVVLQHQGRMVDYSLSAYQGDTLIAQGSHRRAIVETERFMRRVSSKG